MPAKKEAPARPEDMGHKNPPLHELNRRAKRDEQENYALFGGAKLEAEKAFKDHFARGMMRRFQKNLRPPVVAKAE